MKKKKVSGSNIIYILNIALLLALIFLYSSYTNKTNEIKELKTKQAYLLEKIKDKDRTIESIRSNLDTSENELNELNSKIYEFQATLNRYNNEIQENLNWYKQNSNLDDSLRQDKTKRFIKNNCIKIKGNECTIKLSCLYLINSETLGLEYFDDEIVYNQSDRLASLDEFLNNKGGDCEDYSLFFKAEYNYLLSECAENKIIIESWTIPEEESGGERLYVNFQKTYYLDDVKRITFSDYVYPNILCGNLFDPVAQEVGGHCMIAFTNKEINSKEELEYLNSAYIIEPQNGYFMGKVNNKDSEVYLMNKENFYSDEIESKIFSVITDNDYYLFSDESLEWMSLKDFQLQIDNLYTQLNDHTN